MDKCGHRKKRTKIHLKGGNDLLRYNGAMERLAFELEDNLLNKVAPKKKQARTIWI